jgi:hypothetical protein
MCSSWGRPETKSPTSCKRRVNTRSRGAGFWQRGQGRYVSLRDSLIILGLGKSSIRVNAMSGLYSPGPNLDKVLEKVGFMAPVYLKTLVLARLRR